MLKLTLTPACRRRRDQMLKMSCKCHLKFLYFLFVYFTGFFIAIILYIEANMFLSKLEPLVSAELTEYVIKKLHKHDVKTVVDLIGRNSEWLSNIMNLSLKHVEYIKTALTCQCGSKALETSLDLYKRFGGIATIIETGISSLDILLKGGFYIGNLVEIYGLPASGKSLLCTTIAINVSHKLNFSILYIDTKFDFSSFRVHNILKNRQCSEREIGLVMNRIHIKRVYSPEEVINSLKYLIENIEQYPTFKLIIIDSLPSVWFNYQSTKPAEGMARLEEVSCLMSELIYKYNIVVIVVNIAAQNTVFELDGKTPLKCNPIKSSLGEYWQSMPTIRLLLEDVNCNIHDTESNFIDINSELRQINLMHKDSRKNASNCFVQLTNQGIE